MGIYQETIPPFVDTYFFRPTTIKGIDVNYEIILPTNQRLHAIRDVSMFIAFRSRLMPAPLIPSGYCTARSPPLLTPEPDGSLTCGPICRAIVERALVAPDTRVQSRRRLLTGRQTAPLTSRAAAAPADPAEAYTGARRLPPLRRDEPRSAAPSYRLPGRRAGSRSAWVGSAETG